MWPMNTPIGYIEQESELVYGVNNRDGSSYNRSGELSNTKSKIGGAISDAEYCSPETKTSTRGIFDSQKKVLNSWYTGLEQKW